jgi:hypothetical protein
MHFVLSLLVLLQTASLSTPARLPDHLFINNVQWKIAMTDWDPRGVSGLTSYNSHTIYISRKQSLKNEQDTLMHELLHCVMGHKFTDKKVIGHDIIANLTPKLLQLFRDNPELVKYLQQEDETDLAKHSAD